MYFAIEGIDTAGKSTQIELLREHFEDALITKEPGSTPMGEQIRSLILGEVSRSSKCEFLLFLADRSEHFQRVIKPNRNRLIISDRSVVSGVAYALTQSTLSQKEIVELNLFATDSLLPDAIFLLELEGSELEARLSKKSLDAIERRGAKYLLEIQDALREACKLLGVDLITIDASKSIDEINLIITKHIEELNCKS
ncbi:MAG: dTMP kinase [Sulfuricurvum sp.]